jgi:hypothetical protein
MMSSLLPSYSAAGALTTFGSLPPPYVDSTGATNYGAVFAYNAGTAATTPAAATTLYKSPITAACSACHDSVIAVDHMLNNGGVFYGARGASPAINPTLPNPATQMEQCMLCHGPGGVVAIDDMHK